MSAISGPSIDASLPVSGLPPIDAAHEPEVIRNGNAKAKQAYQTGMAFEDMLLNELTQEMTSTVPGLDGSSDGLGSTSDDGLGGTSSGDSSGSSSASSSLGAYSSMLPQALSSDVMSAGGTGLALQIAQSLDPSLGTASTSSTPSTSSLATTSPSTASLSGGVAA
jgi:Rod binding domain-containing protein